MKKDDFYRVITVKDTTKYLVTDLEPDTMYTIEVQSYTAAGSGPQPPSHKAATNKVPNVTGTQALPTLHVTDGVSRSRSGVIFDGRGPNSTFHRVDVIENAFLTVTVIYTE